MQGMNSGAMMNQGPPMSTAAGGMMGGNQVGATAGNIEQRISRFGVNSTC